MNFDYPDNIYNQSSAEIIIPILGDFFEYNSVVDFGCGVATWLSVFKKWGNLDIIGIDGNHVDLFKLQRNIDESEFLALDLEESINLGRMFDLALCLEVAEHLSDKSADILVKNLISHSKIILFSAAIPGQGGQSHLNEQWPEYWADKFVQHGYVFLDLIRPLIWNNPNVDYWYKQNIFLVVKRGHNLAQMYPSSCLSLVHPELFCRKEELFQKRIESLERNLKVHPLKRWLRSLIKS